MISNFKRGNRNGSYHAVMRERRVIGVSMEGYTQRPTTIFVDNLPHQIRKFWVYNLFIKYGKIRDVFIPIKKSKITGQNFGFVRFFRRVDAEVAVAEVNNSWYWDHKLMVKFARFLRKNDDHGFEGYTNSNTSNQNPHFPLVYHQKSWNAKKGQQKKHISTGLPSKSQNQNYQMEKRGKEEWRRKGVVESSKQGEQRNAKSTDAATKRILNTANNTGPPFSKNAGSINVEPAGNGWLCRSAIAKISKLVSTEDLEYIFRREGTHDIQIKPFGGRFVIVTFPDMELRDSTIRKRWLSNWVEEIKPWNGEQAKEERFVWLACYGMPLNAWSVPTFKDIGNKWGHFLQVDENTLKERSFEKGSILIATDQIEKIDGYIELVIQQVKYTVRIEEEETFRFIKKSIFPVTTELPMDEKDEHIEDDVMAMYKGEMEKHDDLETKQGGEESNNNTEVGSSLGIKTSVMGSGYIPDSFEGILNPVEPNYAANSSNILETQDADGSREKVSNEENELEVDNSMEDLVLNHKEINEEGTNTDPIEDNHNPIQAAVKSIKGKKKRKNIDQILGFSKVNTWNQKRGRNKNKCVVLRSAVAAAALSASVSSEGINNRNRILLDRAQTIWAINKMMGIGYDGDEDEVISKIAEMEAQNEDKAEYQL